MFSYITESNVVICFLVADKGRLNRLKWSLREVEINNHVIVPFLDPSFIRNPDFVNEYTAASLVFRIQVFI